MRPWDEVVHVNSVRLKGPALTKSPRREGGPWRHQTSPIECEARGTASSATLLASDLLRKDFLYRAAAGAAVQHCPGRLGFLPHRLMISSNSSEIVSDRAVETATLAKLRRAHTDAAAVAQLVDLVEQIDNIEADLKIADSGNLQIPLKRQINGCVIGHAFGVGEASPKPSSVEKISRRFPVVPSVGSAGCGGPSLVVIEKHPVFVDEGKLIWIKQKLRRAHVDAARPFPTHISIGRERTMVVVRGEFTAVNPAAIVIER